MSTSCHRCGGDLPLPDGATSFCPHCGAPQLYLLEHLLEDLPTETTGAEPPPDARRIEWQPAIRAAMFVALVAPALCLLGSALSIFSLLSLLWIASGSIIAIGIYHKQRPAAFLDARTGARIGLVVGLLMGLALSLTLAVSGVVARFALHRMAGFDADTTGKLRAQIDLMSAQAAAQSNPIPPWLTAIFLSPEFRAAMGLVSIAMLCALVLLLSTLGGAFAGSMRARPRPAA
jgi:hypothetical protein